MLGKTILHYKILEKIGEGGMGVVYLAEDKRLNRRVALKFLPPNLVPDKESLGRLLNEARSASALNHSNVCIIHSIEEYNNESGKPEQFIVMEYVSGTTLRQKNEECPQKIEEAISYAIQIAEALKEAHSKGIAHLDIKSDNIMINTQNQVKVMDFGLAKFRESSMSVPHESTYGTAAYMSPEQAMGKPAGFPSDIWSFGVILYEMITGKLPFIHNYEAAIVYSILNEPPVSPSEIRPDIPQDLEKIILKCLQKEVDNRYKNVERIIVELNGIKEEINLKTIKENYNLVNKKEERKETEQKQATIVYMKIQDYSEIIEKIGNENIVEILERYYGIINQAAQKYNGTVSKAATDEAVLYFGLPITIENSSQKAVNAAFEISNQIKLLNKEKIFREKIVLNVGINTGIVIAGSISLGQETEYTVIGDTVDISSKILETASGGQILVGPLTYRYTKNFFDFRFFKSFSLKGKRDPVKVYQLISVKDNSSQDLKYTKRAIHSEIVGRTNELDKLDYLLLKAINGEGSIVSIIAEAGIGKSRLIEEFKKKEAAKRILVLEGKAVSTKTNISFHPIIELLKQWAQINESDNEMQSFSKLENSIINLFNEEANEIIPFIAALMGFHLTGEYEKRVNEVQGDTLSKIIQKNVRALILKGSQIRPVVFIIEDLHWADLSSIDLFQSLFRLAENNKLLFISTLRPNFQDTGDKLVSSIKEKYSNFYTEIKLQPLNNNECQIFLHNILKIKELPDSLKNSISKSTEGNPFFIEEVIMSLIDDNIIVSENNHFKISGKIENIVIPATIKDLLLSRIDKLNEEAKNILKAASVIGRYFLFDILSAVLKDSQNLENYLDYLTKLELIKLTAESKEREYLFHHALIQEAVYETLLSKNKQDLHCKVANTIENLFAKRIDDFFEILAHHYNLADDREKAEEYLIKAGERSLKNAASNEALTYFRRALKLYLEKYGKAVDNKKIFMLEKNIALSFYNRGYFIDSVEHFIKALEARNIKINRTNLNEIIRMAVNLILILKHLYLPIGKRKNPSEKDYVLFDLLFKLATAYANYNGKKMFFELLNLIRMKMDFNLNGEDGFATYSLAGALFAYSGISFSLSKKFIDKANFYARTNGIDNIYNTGYDETIFKCLSGDWKNFTKINEKLLELKLRNGELVYTIYQISWALYIIICRGEYEYAEYLIKKGDEISETYDFDYGTLYMLSFKSDLNLNKRNLYKAISYFTESCDLAEKLGLNSWILGLSGKRAKAYILLNDLNSAKESLDIAEAALKKEESLTPMLLSYFTAYKLLYFIYLYNIGIKDSIPPERISELRKEIKKNIKAAVKVAGKVAEIKPEVNRYIGVYHAINKDYSKALNYFEKSIEYGKHLESFPELGRSYFEMGKLLSRLNRSYKDKNAEDHFSEAKKIFEKLNLFWDLSELNRVKGFPEEKLSYII